eukprot:gene20312-22311_t
MAEFESRQIVRGKTPHLEDKKHKESIFIAADCFRRQRAFTDVIIVINEDEFPAHRLILAGSSPVLNAMLTADMKEKNEGRINLSDSGIDPDTLEQLLEYMYSGKVNVNMDNVEGLLASSSYLMMQSLNEFCCDYLEKLLRPSNCLQIHEMATKYDCYNLIEKAGRLLSSEFVAIVNSDDFLSISEEMLSEILSKDSIEVNSEDDVLRAVYRWINYQPDERKWSFPKLLQFVRIQFLSNDLLGSIVLHHDYMFDKQNMQSLIMQALQAKEANKECGELLQVGINVKPRTCLNKRKVLFSCGGYDGTKCLQSCFGFLPNEERLCHLSMMKVARQDHAVAEVDGNVYAIGGFSSRHGPLDSTECYNPVRNNWKLMMSMNTKRKSLAVAALNGKLYATGGLDDNYSSLNTTEYYDPQLNRWQSCDNMNESRYSHCLVADEDHIYAIGGWQLSSVERYQPDDRMWTMLSNMSSSRAGASAAVLNEKIYVTGGYGHNGCMNSNEVYDIQQSQWMPIADASISRWRAASSVIDNQMFVIGGRDTNWQYLDSVESFDFNSDQWKSHNGIFAKLMGLQCCTVELPVDTFK